MDKLEPIRRVFLSAGLYHHVFDDVLCGELAAAVQPQPQANAELWALIEELRVTMNKQSAFIEKLAAQRDAALNAAPPPQAEPRVERYGDGVLVHWPDGTTGQYLEAGDCVTAAPQPQAAMLTNPYTGTPRDYRDVESDPAGVLIQEPGAPLRAAPPRPQASAEGVKDCLTTEPDGDWVWLPRGEWVAVPVEPTEAMNKAGDACLKDDGFEFEIYAAMIAAAPAIASKHQPVSNAYKMDADLLHLGDLVDAVGLPSHKDAWKRIRESLEVGK